MTEPQAGLYDQALAARIGGVAGLAAEGVVNSLGQKYLQGDDSSLASLIVVNIGTSAALERLVGALATVRHAEQAGADAIGEVRKLQRVARKGVAMAKATATLADRALATFKTLIQGALGGIVRHPLLCHSSPGGHAQRSASCDEMVIPSA